MQEPSTAVGLSASHLAVLFPFHFAINRQFKFIQLGPGITQNFDPDIDLNAYLDNFFEITTPSSLLNWGYLRSMENELCSLRHKRTQIEFTARILPADNDKLIFLIKPLITTGSYLSRLGMRPTDFLHHDIVNDLFLHRKKANSRNELNLSDALATQEQQLKEILHTLASQEAESRKLAHIISRSTYWIIIANAHGFVEWANAAFLESPGHVTTEVVGSQLSELLGIPSADFAAASLSLQTEGRLQHEVSFIENGHLRWIDIDVRALLDDDQEIINFIAIGRDITEQKQAQKISQRLTLELNSIFDLSPDGFVSFDENGHLSQVNQAFLRMTGLDNARLQEVSVQNFEQLLTDLNERKTLAPGEEKNQLIKISKPKLSIIKHAVKTLSPMDNNNQKTIHYFQDITHEYELSRMKGEFLSMAAHELRTPMASIFGFTDLLLKRDYSTDQTREILQNVFRQATRMTKLINDLLDLARIEAKGKLDPKAETITVEQLIENAGREFKSHSADRTLKIAPFDSQLKIRGDHDKLLQVLLNLLTNADKYSHPGTEILLEIQTQYIKGVSCVGLTVIDSGVGMSKKDVDNLFQPFFRATRTIKIPGTGLGMSIVKQIVEAHSGEIEVTSIPEQGTRITVWIPQVQ